MQSAYASGLSPSTTNSDYPNWTQLKYHNWLKRWHILYIHMIQVPGAEKYPAFPVPIGIDGMSAQAHLGVKRTLQRHDNN